MHDGISEKNIVTFDCKIIDISNLTVNELLYLQYEQEKSFADLIRQAKPFSPKRALLMKNGYETINKIMIVRKTKEGKQLESYGATNAYVKLVKKIIKKKLTKKQKCVFFEAGVGTGKVINEIVELPNVTAIGCDTYIDRNYINSDLNIFECTVYEALLKLEDNTIDVFYWNDVMEHIPEDEAEEHIKLLSKKMSSEGFIITITPNRLKGPCDITEHFEPHGTIAKGFHFHEYTFQEILTIFEKYNIISVYGVLDYTTKGLYILGPVQLDRVKLFIEKNITKLPYTIKKNILVMAGCDVSILKKVIDKTKYNGA